MEFIHQTFQRPSYLINVIPGVFLPDVQGKQFLINFHTYFEIFSLHIKNNETNFKSIHTQDFFCKVNSVDSGPEIADLTSFFQLTKSKIIQLIYSSEHNLFVIVKTIDIPELCIHPSYILYLRTSLVVSSTNGAICSFSLPNFDVTFLEKPTNIVFQCIRKDIDSMIRVEGGSMNIVLYGKSPFERKELFSFDIKATMIFPFESDQIIICENEMIHLLNNSSISSINLNEILKESDGDAGVVIGHCQIDSSLHLILTSNGFLFSIERNFDVKYISQFPGANNIFFVNLFFVIITVNFGQSFLYNFISKQVIKLFEWYFGYMDLQPFRKGNYISSSKSKIISRKFGLEITEKDRFIPDIENLQNIIPFEISNVRYYVYVDNEGSSIFAENVNIYFENFNSDILTIFAKSFTLNNNSNVMVQITKDNIYIDGKVIKNLPSHGEIVSFAENRFHLMVYWSSYYFTFISLNKNENGLRIMTEKDENYITSCCFPPNKKTPIVVATVLKKLIVKSDEDKLNMDIPAIVSDMAFLDDTILVIGYENGYLSIGKFNVSYEFFETSQYMKIGDKKVKIKKNGNVVYAISDDIWIVYDFKNNNLIKPLEKNDFTDVFMANEGNEFFIINSENEIINYEINLNSDLFTSMEYDFPKHEIDNLISLENIGCTIFRDKNTIYLFITYGEYQKLKKIYALPSSDQNFEKIRVIKYDKINSYLYISVSRGGDCKMLVGKLTINQLESSFEKKFTFDFPRETYNFALIENGFVYEYEDSLFFYQIDGNKFQLKTKIQSPELRLKNSLLNNNCTFVLGRNQCMYKLLLSDDNVKIITNPYPRKITFGCEYKDGCAVYGDREGNVAIYSDANSHFSSLITKTSLNTGYPITGIAYKKCTNNLSLYTTISGELGAILEINNEQLKMEAEFLKKIEMKTAAYIQEKTGAMHYVFRNLTIPCRNILDLDMISIFMKLNKKEKANIMSSLSVTCTDELIDQYLTHISAFFMFFAV